jgi:hypothetical protein
MTPMATSWREGGLTSCRSRSQKLHLEELETLKAAHKLLGAPTIGRGSVLAGGYGRGS